MLILGSHMFFECKYKSFTGILFFFSACFPILSLCKANHSQDPFSHGAFSYQVDEQSLKNFFDSTQAMYQSVWHDMINENYNSGLPYRIPKIIHVVWFGNPMPEINRSYIETWKKHHPNWQFYLWDEAAIAKEFSDGLENQLVFDQVFALKNYAAASDIARLEVLKRFGGLYVDSDAECLRSFDILNQKFDFYAAKEWNEDIKKWNCVCGNAVIGSVPKHPVLDLSIADARKIYVEKHQEACSDNKLIRAWEENLLRSLSAETAARVITTIALTGPGSLTRSLIRYFEQADSSAKRLTFIGPRKYFYDEIEPIFATHEFHGSFFKSANEIPHKKAKRIRKNLSGGVPIFRTQNSKICIR